MPAFEARELHSRARTHGMTHAAACQLIAQEAAYIAAFLCTTTTDPARAAEMIRSAFEIEHYPGADIHLRRRAAERTGEPQRAKLLRRPKRQPGQLSLPAAIHQS